MGCVYDSLLCRIILDVLAVVTGCDIFGNGFVARDGLSVDMVVK